MTEEIPSDIPELRDRPPASHKGDYGRLVILAGSRGMAGASVLVSRSALRSGCGLVYTAVPEGIYEVVAGQLTCPLVHGLPDDQAGYMTPESIPELHSWIEKADAVAIGPGMGTASSTGKALELVLEMVETPSVLDADALNIISQNKDLMEEMPDHSVFTPHPGEFSRLTDRPIDEIQENRTSMARAYTSEHQITLVLKGHETVVATPGGDVFVNPSGNSGMATGGTGDVLTGMIGSFLAQGYEPGDAAVLGVYLHGLSGDFAVEQRTPESLVATDLIDSLPDVFRFLREERNDIDTPSSS